MDKNSILIFGAGKIGRSFIGQLFGQSGYHILFVDIDPEIVDQLNQRNSYPVVIKGKIEKTILVENVKALSALDVDAVKNAIARTSIMAVSVGKNALEKIIPVIAAGLMLRQKLSPDSPLDIIIAENMRSANLFIRSQLIQLLPENFPLEKMLGLVETSIGKMVPIMTKEDLKQDPLMIFAEPYNNLILDRKGFKGTIPKVEGLSPKKNIKAWVDRKAFIHNMGHATSAYIGNFYQPHATYIYEVLDNKNILNNVRLTMLQAATILRAHYPEEFTYQDLEKHIDDLLDRFQNRSLKDTVFRVGQDLSRKLGIDDRFAGIIKMALKKGLKYDRIIKSMAYGFFFNKPNQQGNLNNQDEQFLRMLNEMGVKSTLEILCGFHPENDSFLIDELELQYLKLKKKEAKLEI